jgi:hypothetical protein
MPDGVKAGSRVRPTNWVTITHERPSRPCDARHVRVEAFAASQRPLIGLADAAVIVALLAVSNF